MHSTATAFPFHTSGEFEVPVRRKKRMTVPRPVGSPIRVIDSGIAPDYATSGWGIPQAVREWYQNAKDTGTRVRAEWRDGYTFIEDEGSGLTIANLVLGNSEKAEDDSRIGQFGEGAKMGLKVAAVLGRPHGIETVGFTVVAEIRLSQNYSVFDPTDPQRIITPVHTLHYVIYRNRRRKGTLVWCETTREEYEEGLGYFLEHLNLTPLDESLGLYSKPEGGKGTLFILGVKVQEIPSIICYNVNDKRMVNRDRTFTDLNEVNERLRQAWSATRSPKAIRYFLTELHKPENARALENMLDVWPEAPDLWLNEARRIWRNPVLSGPTVENDLAAKVAGYTVLRNLPHGLERVLERAGVPRSHEVIPDAFRPFEQKNRYVLTINPEWGQDMSMVQALCELAANSLDAAVVTPGDRTKTPVWQNGFVEFVNTKARLHPRHLILGTGESDGTTTIGRFHMGLKQVLACVVRHNRRMTLELVGETLTVDKEYDPEFDATLIVLHRKKNRKRQGTRIRVEADFGEYLGMLGRFTAFNKMRYLSPGILSDSGGKLFVQGVYVRSILSQLSFDLDDGGIVTMDRQNVDMARLLAGVARALGRCTNRQVIRKVLTGWREDPLHAHEYLEYRVVPQFTPEAQKVWASVMRREFPKACLNWEPESDHQAQYRGWEVLSNLPGELYRTLRELGMKYSRDVVRLSRPLKDQTCRIGRSKLTKEERRNLRIVRRFFRTFFPEDASKPVYVVQDRAPNGTRVIWGYYESSDDAIYVNRRLLSAETHDVIISLIGTLVHEQAHRMSRSDDLTVGFEHTLTILAGYGFAAAMRIDRIEELRKHLEKALHHW